MKKDLVEDRSNDEVIAIFDIGMGTTKFGWIKSDDTLELLKMPSSVKLNVNDGMERIIINDEQHDFRSSVRVQQETKSASKATDHHKALMRKGLYEIHLRTGATKFKVIAACSLDSYKTKNKGEDVYEKLWDSSRKGQENTFKIGKFGEELVELTITELKVKPETISGLTAMGIRLKEKTVIAIDIGYYNFAMLPVRDLIPDYDNMHFTSQGMYTLLQNIVENANKTTTTIDGKKLDESNIEANDRLLQDLNAIPEAEEYFKVGLKPIFEQVEKILAQKYMLNNKSKNLTLAFIGGGSETLRSFIVEHFKTIKKFDVKVDNDPVFATLRGLARRAKKEFGVQ